MIHAAETPVELRHLRVLRALLAENSVSRAAEALGQSQPAISSTLKQLRELFCDPLLVRSGGGMVPTERALAIADSLARVLDAIDDMVEPPGLFEPSTSTRSVRIVSYPGPCARLVPAIVRIIRAEAPDLRLEIVQPGPPESTRQQLHDREVDLVIAYRQGPFQNLRFAPLLECDIACVLSATHPLAWKSALTLEEYLALKHLSPSSPTVLAGAPIDGRLLELGVKRDIAVTVPEYALAGAMLPSTQLVFTTARPNADELAAYLPLVVLGAPQQLGRLSAFMFWHDRNHQSALSKWLRSKVRIAAGQVP